MVAPASSTLFSRSFKLYSSIIVNDLEALDYILRGDRRSNYCYWFFIAKNHYDRCDSLEEFFLVIQTRYHVKCHRCVKRAFLLFNYFNKTLCSLRMARCIFSDRSNLLVLSWWMFSKHWIRFWEGTIIYTIVINYLIKETSMMIMASSRHFVGPPNWSFIMLVVLDALDEILRGDYRLNNCY